MSEYTTIKIGKATNKAVVKYKALLERLCGKSLSNDVVIFLAISTSDFQLSKETGIATDDNPIIHITNFQQDIEQNGTEDEKKSLKNLSEDIEAWHSWAFGFKSTKETKNTSK